MVIVRLRLGKDGLWWRLTVRMVSYDYTIEAGGTGAWWFVASDSGGQWLSHIDPRGVK